MVEEFNLPDSIIDRKVRNMKMISPSNREVDIQLDPLGYDENAYIGMCRREVFDAFLRNRAADLGTTLINGLVQKSTPAKTAKGRTASTTPTTAVAVRQVWLKPSMWI